MPALAGFTDFRYVAAMLRGTGRGVMRPLFAKATVQGKLRDPLRRGLGRAISAVLRFPLLAILLLISPIAAAMTEGAHVFPMEDTVMSDILNAEDVVRYQRIFELQEEGKWRAADKEIAQLEDRILMGHVLYQRYMHPTKYRSKYSELSKWMAAYADHPGAYRVYRLARKRKPVKTHAPRRPFRPTAATTAEADRIQSNKYVSPRKRSRSKRAEVSRLERHVRSHIRARRLDAAIKHLKSREYRDVLDGTEIDILYGRIAKGYLNLGYNDRAYELASKSAARARLYEPVIDLHAGLAAWRLGKKDKAAEHFSALAISTTATSREIAAGAFWATRAYLVERKPQQVSRFLKIGASYPRTFYGQLARRMLGDEGLPAWEAPVLFPSEYAKLKDSPYIQRAIALAQIDRRYWAEREIRTAFQAASSDSRKSLLALAVRLGLPGAELRMARSILAAEGDAYDRALFPLPPWKPEGGFKVDRAVLFALMRQESGFNSRAKSGAGARGLMQLMPRTASFMARDRSLRGRNKQKLFAPEYNVHLGQKYIVHLMTDHEFLDNLIMVVSAYNGGPGNVRKWQRRIKEADDPLMFIESLPSLENREFVRRVMANMWIYRARLGQPAPSLDALAEGRWPIYEALDSRVTTARHQEVNGNVFETQ